MAESPVLEGVASPGTPVTRREPPATAPRRPGDRLWRQLLVAAAAYLAVSLLVWARIWLTGSPSHSLTCPCGDVAEQLWWFEWLPRALQHGHNPFYSTAMFARFGGVNAMTNTSWMLPAALLAPVTLAFGPVASSNVANLLAPVLTGLAAYALAARLTRLVPARLVAGLAFAFSPFVMGNVDVGHVNLTLLVYPPLVLLVGDRLVRGETSPQRAGVWLGVLTVAEAFVGIELLVLTAALAIGCVLGVALVRRDLLVDGWRAMAGAAAIAGAICAIALAYPAYVFLAGPQHVAGPFWPFLRGLRGPGSLLPAAGYRAPSLAVRSAGYEGASGPGSGFLGIGIFLVVALGFLVARRRRCYQVLSVAALVCLCGEANLLSFLGRVPVLDDLVVVRFTIGTTLCFALLLALVVDGWWLPARTLPQRLRERVGAWGSALAALACVLVAIVPVAAAYDVPFVVQTATTPTWFTTAGSTVPSRTAVLVLPFAWYTSDDAMAWQAESGLRFSLVGGFGFIPGADGTRDEFLSRLPDARLLQQLSRGTTPLSAAQRARLGVLLASWAPLEVVAIDHDVRPEVLATLTEVLGGPPRRVDGATTWVTRGAPPGRDPARS
ncbi:MAG TPA: hypothetical protein VGZ33_01715 [Acidimicrobiales bacterium]|nr:hypothetical protein [Acidimicrobiales bacterium]